MKKLRHLDILRRDEADGDPNERTAEVCAVRDGAGLSDELARDAAATEHENHHETQPPVANPTHNPPGG